MPTQSLPAASLRTANCLPVGRMLIQAGNPLSYRVLWAIWRAISVVESIFLRALREAPGGSRRSAGHALGAGRDVVEGQGHRYARVKAHQADDVGDADMAERLDRAVVEPFRDPARIGKTSRHLVNHLLALVVERGRQARQQRLDLVGREPRRLPGALVRVGRVDRMPLAVDDDDGDLALALAQRITGAEIGTERPHHLGQLG